MSKLLRIACGVVLTWGMMQGESFAQAKGHYVNGVEGI